MSVIPTILSSPSNWIAVHPPARICPVASPLFRSRSPFCLTFLRRVSQDDHSNAERADISKKKKKKLWFQSFLLQGLELLGVEGVSFDGAEEGLNEGSWEDWLDEEESVVQEENESRWDKGGLPREEVSMPERGMFRNDLEITSGLFYNSDAMEEDVKYEDEVFQYATQTTAKFMALLIIVPWAVGFVVHDYVLLPFLNRYVEHVPFAAQMLDVKKQQKLQIMDAIKREKLRLHFEAEIRQIPELTEDELWEHSKCKAKELREELRLENRKAFANIWSDMIVGITAVFVYFLNPSKVEVMKFTGSRILKGISDTGKAFLLILVTDIFLGYHSESGWHTLIEMLLEHYGLIIDDAAITVFICTVPVTIDVCFKLWVFKYLPRLSPSTAATFHEMKRH
eukprot:TRINITY_DN28136_c0_g1_i1.p1 TRINITY_DN28136_c0_g1~~TRINITY_DN28136_c0_g1_i1.p1  ORF type:complete len:396 (-),score=78.13 TRINITY_DN28136_c0_g1_i1:131-1318(-)